MHAIGVVAKATGLKIPTIRFYEGEGMIAAPERSDSGRRLYSDADISRLAFIRHARTLGFELDDIRSLLALSDRPNMSCAKADEIAQEHLKAIEDRIMQLTLLKKELSRIARSCAGGKLAKDCRVIEALAGHEHCQSEHAPAALRKAPSSKAARGAKARKSASKMWSE